MSKTKPITQISAEDLLKIVQDSKDIKDESNYSYRNDILEFISTFNLKQGEESVTGKLLHNIYKSWSSEPLCKREFIKQMNLFFSHKRISTDYLILLNLDYNELLRKTSYNLKTKSKTKRKYYKEHFDNYLNKYSINSGGFFVKDTILYNLYDKWTYSFKKSHPLGPIQFNSFCKLYFKFKYIERNFWFGVDKSIIQHLSEDNINEMRKSKNVKETIKTK